MSRRPSPQATAVLAALREEAEDWLHGYELARRTGLKPGTLYPILERLEKRGVLEGRWERSPFDKRPPRHVYRLTQTGLQERVEQERRPQPAPRPGRREAPA